MARKVGVFHPGTQHSWQTALAFQESGQLGWYATSVFYDPARWPYRIERWVPRGLADQLHREFARRQSPALRAENVRQFGFWEWLETGARRAGAARLEAWANRRGNASFGEQVIRLIEREPVDLLWGYNTSSVEVFRWAKKRGITCVLDQTVGHYAALNRVMLSAQARNPEFFLQSYEPYPPAVIAQQNEELALADVVTVGCDYCARTLIENGCPAEKIRIIGYGFDDNLFPDQRPTRPPLGNRPVRFLFVGAINPRKGVATLLPAFERLPEDRATLTLVGNLEIPRTTFERYRSRVNHVGSVSRSEVVKYFLNADCFVFPSLFEGSAIVLYEAIAAGLGIIQSIYAGEGARRGQNGEVLADVTVDRLHAALEAVIARPDRLTGWQEESWRMRGQCTWRTYREHVVALII